MQKHKKPCFKQFRGRVSCAAGEISETALLLHSNLYYTLIYRVALDEPIRFIVPLFTIAPRTASTVVGLTSGRILHISALESSVRLFKIAASTQAFFVIFFDSVKIISQI